jgi:hypothetical protein
VPYWSRHWVAQEIILSKKRLIVYGHTSGEWESLDNLVYKHDWMFSKSRISSFQALITFCSKSTGYDGAFWQMAMLFAYGSNCENPRDKIYAIQGLLDQRLHVEVDYAFSTKKLFFKAVRLWYDLLEPKSRFLTLYFLAVGMKLGPASPYAILKASGSKNLPRLSNEQLNELVVDSSRHSIEQVISALKLLIELHERNTDQRCAMAHISESVLEQK